MSHFQSCTLKPSRPCRAAAVRRGLSALELVVAISIVALLLALLIPAVQSARETSRRTTCASNLKNAGIALESYSGMHPSYPDGCYWREAVLPFLDGRALADAIAGNDFTVSLTDHHLPALTCPSDSLGDAGGMRSNYFGNMGTGRQKYGFNGFFSPKPGGIEAVGAWNTPLVRGPTRPADMRDGLSHTAAVSEALVQELPPSARPDLRRGVWELTGWDLVLPENLETVKNLCLAVEPDSSHPQIFGRGWEVLGTWTPPYRSLPLSPLSWGYDHALPPNSPACLVGSSFGVLSAASLHRRGVNVLYGDGRVAFVSDQIDGRIWPEPGDRSSNLLRCRFRHTRSPFMMRCLRSSCSS